jgi:hypothetical protein
MRQRAVRDWPGLMKSTTARAYLDEMPEPVFKAFVTPHLERKVAGNTLYFTRASIDAWILAGGTPGEAQTPEDLMRMLDDDDTDRDARRHTGRA